jgi:hypothetical protein
MLDCFEANLCGGRSLRFPHDAAGRPRHRPGLEHYHRGALHRLGHLARGGAALPRAENDRDAALADQGSHWSHNPPFQRQTLLADATECGAVGSLRPLPSLLVGGWGPGCH